MSAVARPSGPDLRFVRLPTHEFGKSERAPDPFLDF